METCQTIVIREDITVYFICKDCYLSSCFHNVLVLGSLRKREKRNAFVRGDINLSCAEELLGSHGLDTWGLIS
jgi:hypothetical protein